jgi:hypothetical protein
LIFEKHCHRASGDGLRRRLLAVALVEGLQLDEGEADILALPPKPKPATRQHALDIILLIVEIMVLDLLEHFKVRSCGGADRQLDHW